MNASSSSANASLLTCSGQIMVQNNRPIETESKESSEQKQNQELNDFMAIYTALMGKPALVIQDVSKQVKVGTTNSLEICGIINDFIDYAEGIVPENNKMLLNKDSISALCTFPNGQIAVGDMYTVELYDSLQSKHASKMLRNEPGAVTSLALLSNNRLASGAVAGIIRVFDLKTSDLVNYFQNLNHRGFPERDPINAIAQVDDNTVACAASRTITIWNLEEDSTQEPKILQLPNGGPIRALAGMNDKKIVCGTEDGTIHIIDPNSLQIVQSHKLSGEGLMEDLKVFDNYLIFKKRSYSRETESLFIQSLNDMSAKPTIVNVQEDAKLMGVSCDGTIILHTLKLTLHGGQIIERTDYGLRTLISPKSVMLSKLSALLRNAQAKDFAAIMYALTGKQYRPEPIDFDSLKNHGPVAKTILGYLSEISEKDAVQFIDSSVVTKAFNSKQPKNEQKSSDTTQSCSQPSSSSSSTQSNEPDNSVTLSSSENVHQKRISNCKKIMQALPCTIL